MTDNYNKAVKACNNKNNTDGIIKIILDNLDDKGQIASNKIIVKRGNIAQAIENPTENDIELANEFYTKLLETYTIRKKSDNSNAYLFLYKQTGNPKYLKYFVDMTNNPEKAKLYADRCGDEKEKIKYLAIAHHTECLYEIAKNKFINDNIKEA